MQSRVLAVNGQLHVALQRTCSEYRAPDILRQVLASARESIWFRCVGNVPVSPCRGCPRVLRKLRLDNIEYCLPDAAGADGTPGCWSAMPFGGAANKLEETGALAASGSAGAGSVEL